VTRGRFGPYGGRYVAETLVPALAQLEAAWDAARADPSFQREVDAALASWAGRPTPLTEAPRLAATLGEGVRVWLKREDLCHTGAHKINNCVGQALLARRMGKTRIIAETGAGQHGVATAAIAARLGLSCEVYMGALDAQRQEPNLRRMRLFGASVRVVDEGTATLKDAMNAAMRDWVTNVAGTYYLVGSVAGPHPYPTMVRDFQAVIGREARAALAAAGEGLPDLVVACVGGGSNAMGIFHAFVGAPEVSLVGVEAAGRGIDTGEHAATLTAGSPGVLHGMYTMLLQDDDGQIRGTHSIAAGLDYPGVGPEHAFLRESGRAEYVSVTDDEALAACRRLAETEGILPALETSHALAALGALVRAKGAKKVLVNLSGRGDKDLSSLV
jgi:tryptophan synthase beta chain